MALSLSEQMLYNSIRLNPTKGGIPNGVSGTGFFFTFKDKTGKSNLPALITNKHVLSGADGLSAFWHRAKDGLPCDESLELHLSFANCPLVKHPSEDIDLVAILIGPFLRACKKNDNEIYYSGIGPSNIPKSWADFDALEEVTMVGCPRGIMDEYNKLPIFRRGHTASAISKDYNGRSEFLIDMACFPGSSGSPVFIHNEGGYFDARSQSMTLGSRFFFVGVLYSGPTISSTGEILLAQPHRFSVSNMMHLGQVVRSSELLVMDTIVQLRFFS